MVTVPATRHELRVPANDLMVGLLGERDELLRLVEAAFPDTSIHVRGNAITLDGPAADDLALVFGELVTLLQGGHVLDEASVLRALEMVAADERPSQVLSM